MPKSPEHAPSSADRAAVGPDLAPGGAHPDVGDGDFTTDHAEETRMGAQDPSRRLKVWVAGAAGLLTAVAIQWPFLAAAFHRGWDFAPGRTGLVTTWGVLVVATDALLLLLWTAHRPKRWAWATLPALAALLLWWPLALVALLLRGLFR